MSVYKNDKGKWTAYIRYKDWQGKNRVKKSEIFKTKKEALEFERQFIAKKARDITMNFRTFVDIYIEDMKPQLKLNTMETKIQIIDSHIVPYFECKSLCDINSTDILQWQNDLLNMRDSNDRAYSPTYLRTIQNQLHTIFNHAVKYYDMPKNPCKTVNKMGKAKAKEMMFWTKEEYMKFIETMKNKPVSYYLFEILYWTGIREGELLALSKKDFDLENKTVSITRSYQKNKRSGDNYIT